MIRRIAFAGSLSVAVILCLSTTGVARADVSLTTACHDQTPQNGAVMHEYKGVRLGMSRDQVKEVAGKPSDSTDTSDDFKLTGEDMMTIHYENNMVKAIQIAFFDIKNVPEWKTVVGDAEVNHSDSGARHARKVMADDNYWVSIWQNKDGSMTRITISR